MRTMKTYIAFLILAATLSGLKVHVVIVILGISPKRIVWVIYDGGGFSTLAYRTGLMSCDGASCQRHPGGELVALSIISKVRKLRYRGITPNLHLDLGPQ
jgi:hypothetical protein